MKWACRAFIFQVFLLFVSIQSLAATSPSQFRNVLLNQGYIEVPIRWADNGKTLIIEASLENGKKRAFILDTGTVLTSIDPRVVKREGLTENKDISLETGGMDSHRHTSYQVVIPSLHFTHFTSHQVVTFTEDESVIEVDEQPIAGKIGLDFLRKHSVVIDVPMLRVYLKPDNSQPAQIIYPSNLDELGYQKIQLERAPSRHQTITVRINNQQPAQFLLDCGMPFTAVSLKFAKHLDLHLHDDSIEATGSGGGTLDIYRTYINKFYVGTLRWKIHQILAMDFTYIQVGIPLSGVVGIDWLAENGTIMDVANDILFVRG